MTEKFLALPLVEFSRLGYGGWRTSVVRQTVQQTIHVWVEDQPGALMRVAGIITAKGANIRTLTVTPDAGQPGTARIVIGAEVEPRLRKRVVHEMNRLIQVLEAIDISADGSGA